MIIAKFPNFKIRYPRLFRVQITTCSDWILIYHFLKTVQKMDRVLDVLRKKMFLCFVPANTAFDDNGWPLLNNNNTGSLRKF